MKRKTKEKKQSNNTNIPNTHYYETLRVYIHTLEALNVPIEVKERSILEFLGKLCEAINKIKSAEGATSNASKDL